MWTTVGSLRTECQSTQKWNFTSTHILSACKTSTCLHAGISYDLLFSFEWTMIDCFDTWKNPHWVCEWFNDSLCLKEFLGNFQAYWFIQWVKLDWFKPVKSDYDKLTGLKYYISFLKRWKLNLFITGMYYRFKIY